MNNQTTPAPQSYFDGGLLQLIGYGILAVLIISFTLFLGTPWAVCLFYSWEKKHTVVDGRRLTFDGNGAQLFGTFIKWVLLCIITLGIYSLWIPISIKKWVAKHTHVAR